MLVIFFLEVKEYKKKLTSTSVNEYVAIWSKKIKGTFAFNSVHILFKLNWLDSAKKESGTMVLINLEILFCIKGKWKNDPTTIDALRLGDIRIYM